jgi:hypothetical protein
MVNSSASLHALLVKHDPYVKNILVYSSHVKVFQYSARELHWDNDVCLEGCLIAYERDRPFNKELDSVYALVFINSQRNLLQPIQLHMSMQPQQSRLFYEVTLDEQPEVFCVFFDQESECLRIHQFIQQVIKRMQGAADAHAQRTQTPVMVRLSIVFSPPMDRYHLFCRHETRLTGKIQWIAQESIKRPSVQCIKNH